MAKRDLKDYKGAIEDFDKAVDLKPNFGNAYSNRGRTKIAFGDTADGCADIRMAVKLGVTKGLENYRDLCK